MDKFTQDYMKLIPIEIKVNPKRINEFTSELTVEFGWFSMTFSSEGDSMVNWKVSETIHKVPLYFDEKIDYYEIIYQK